jgi:hypothetical protein
MNGHVSEWLGAYLDGELSFARRQQVHAHLEICKDCLAELEGLRRVSAMLHSAPVPEFTPADTFAARLTLQLPRREPVEQPPGRPSLLWYTIPALILAAWFFYRTVLAVSGLAGVLGGANLPGGDPVNGSHSLWFSALSGLFDGRLNSLPQAMLTIADQVSLIAVDVFHGLFWQTLAGLFYLAWLAAWLIRHTPRQAVQRGARG